MQHICAFSFTASNTGAGTFVTVPAIIDSYLTTNANTRFVVPGPQGGGQSPWRLRMGYVQGTGTTVARIFNAYMRRVMLPSIANVNATAAVPSAYWVQDWGDYGPQLPVSDEFGIEADNTGANVQTGMLVLHDGNNVVPMGERFVAQFLCTNGGSATQATTVANAWTAANIVFTQSLPPGRYAAIGLDVVGTTLIAARLVNVNAGPRPGIIARAAQTVFATGQFRFGNLGTMMEFVPTGQPLIELFDSAAVTAAFTGYLDLVKIG